MEKLEDIYELLFSAKKLDRDQGMNHLKKYLNESSLETMHSVQKMLLDVLNNPESGWESKHGALLGAKAVIIHSKRHVFDDTVLTFLTVIHKLCLDFLTDNEVRIRLAAGEVLGSLCELRGPQVYSESKDYLIQLIKDNMERDVMDTSDVFTSDAESDSSDSPKQQRVRRLSSDAAQIFHDTAGWKCLETSMNKKQNEKLTKIFRYFKDYLIVLPAKEIVAWLIKALLYKTTVPRFKREEG
ncbi:uncharacterized protein TNCV_837661 [Trichonephila clavipes]|nr:uncharacterized protein TNCV_837661 [Trichonephila clavipes]